MAFTASKLFSLEFKVAMQAPRQASRRRVGQHAKREAGWEEERTGGGAVERGERIGNGCGCLPGA